MKNCKNFEINFVYHTDDWRADQFRWRQSGSGEFYFGNIPGKKIYVYAITRKDENGKNIYVNRI